MYVKFYKHNIVRKSQMEATNSRGLNWNTLSNKYIISSNAKYSQFSCGNMGLLNFVGFFVYFLQSSPKFLKNSQKTFYSNIQFLKRSHILGVKKCQTRWTQNEDILKCFFYQTLTLLLKYNLIKILWQINTSKMSNLPRLKRVFSVKYDCICIFLFFQWTMVLSVESDINYRHSSQIFLEETPIIWEGKSSQFKNPMLK